MMKKYRVYAFLIFLVMIMTSCSSANSDDEGPENQEPINQVGDFQVEIFSEDSEETDTPEIYATITYLGNQSEIEVLHSEVLIYFILYSEGKVLFPSSLANIGINTTLLKNEPLKIQYSDEELDQLDPGTYEIGAVASFLLDETDYRIPVSTKIVIE